MKRMDKTNITIDSYNKSAGQYSSKFMESEGSGYKTTSFSNHDIYFNYYKKGEIQELLASHSLQAEEIPEFDYEEADEVITKDIFIIAKKAKRYPDLWRKPCLE
ncbi:MAG: hypothetical protein J7K90_13755 [Desulfuromusa sp.]|nr:hypothetical protein [Desulfuromusa sp.]